MHVTHLICLKIETVIICWVVWFVGIHLQLCHEGIIFRNAALFPESFLVHWKHAQDKKYTDANLKVSYTSYRPFADRHMTTPGFVAFGRVFAWAGWLEGMTPRKWIWKDIHSPRVICRTCLRSLGSLKRIVLPSMKLSLTVSRYLSGNLRFDS